MKFSIPTGILAALVTLVSAVSAWSQEVSALKDHDTNEIIDITADQFEIRQRENLAIFSGSVEVRQGDLFFEAAVLTAYYEAVEGATNPTIARLDVSGDVRLTSPSESVRGDWGVYDVKARLITLGGAVILERGDTTIIGERLELDLETGITKFDSVDAGQETGRVRGRFTVPENKNDN